MIIPAFVVRLSIEIFMPFGNKYYDFSGQMGHYWHFEQRKGTLRLHEYSLRATRIFVQGCLHICSWSRVYSLIVARMALHPPGLHLDGVERAAVLSLAGNGVLNTEIAANCFHKIGQLALITARIRYRIGHHAAWLLPSEVGVLKFRTADVCAKDGEKHRNQGLAHVF
jgi:hypothetical protein